MDTPSPGPSVDPYQIQFPSIRVAYYLHPLGWSFLLLLVFALCVLAAYHSRGDTSFWPITGAAGLVAALGIWQFATFWHRANRATASAGLHFGALVMFGLIGFLFWAIGTWLSR